MKSIVFSLILLAVAITMHAETIPFLGVSTKDIDHYSYAQYQITDGYGILIVDVVKGSAAETAGLAKEQIIRTYNGEKVYTRSQLTRMIRNSSIGDKILITTWEKGGDASHQVILGEKEEKSHNKRAWMGISLSEDLQNDQFTENYGLLVTVISEDSPADKAGLNVDDIILSINKEKLYCQDQVRPMMHNFQPGDKINVKYWRNNDYLETTLTLAEMSKDLFEVDDLFHGLDIIDGLDDIYGLWNIVGLPEKLHILAYQDSSSKILGVIISEAEDGEKEQMKPRSGLLIEKVIPETPAETGGLLSGDVILSINGTRITEFDDIGKVLSGVDFDQDFQVTIMRKDQEKQLTITLKPVSDDVWSKYYSNVLENDILKEIMKNKKPIDYFYKSLEDFEKKLPRDIQIEIKGLDESGPM